MTTTVYVLVQYNEYLQDKVILSVFEDMQAARIAKTKEYISLWKRIETDDDPRLKKIWYEIEQVLFIKS